MFSPFLPARYGDQVLPKRHGGGVTTTLRERRDGESSLVKKGTAVELGGTQGFIKVVEGLMTWCWMPGSQSSFFVSDVVNDSESGCIPGILTIFQPGHVSHVQVL